MNMTQSVAAATIGPSWTSARSVHQAIGRQQTNITKAMAHITISLFRLCMGRDSLGFVWVGVYSTAGPRQDGNGV